MDEGDFASAGEAFESLGDYKNSEQLMQICLYEVAVAALAQQDPELAYELAEKMDESTYTNFIGTYVANYADLQVLTILEQALALRLQEESRTDLTLFEMLRPEYDSLANIEALPGYADTRLEELISTYCHGVQLQFGAVDEYTGAFDNHDFYLGAYERAYAVETLMEEYSFLEENGELAEVYIGATARFEAIMDLQVLLEDTLADAEWVAGGDGNLYLSFTNTTETAANILFAHAFYEGVTYVGGNESYQYVLPGETIYIPIEEPASYDEWFINWDFLTVYYGEKLQVEAGTYKLESMIVEGVFCDGTVLETLSLTPESVVVTIQNDGTGIWTEMGESSAFSYTSNLIAIDGTDLRLPYSAAPGKLVVNLGENVYVLTLESHSA